MSKFDITGMSCAACSARVEKAVCGLPGVSACSVSLLTNSMSVEGSASDSDIIKAVENAGYGATKQGSEKEKKQSADNQLRDTETPKMKRRLVWSLVFLAVLMYFSMGSMMFGLPAPDFIENNHAAMGLLQMLLTVAVMVINQKFFINGFKGLAKGAPNMDTLVALGSTAAFIYSTYALFMITEAYAGGNAMAAHEYMHELYFESAAMILALITVGKMLEARSKGKTTDALKSLMKLAPKTATLLIDGQQVSVPVENVKKGNIFIVRPGESIPADGVVISGGGAVNESALTGESIPVDKEINDTVSAATVNLTGYMECKATRVGEDTTLSQIIKMVSDAAQSKAPIAKIADKVSGVFVPIVMGIAVITVIVWLILDKGIGFALARGISVLVISCPCALGLATPVAIMVGNGVGAKNGILFKTATALEQAGKVKTVVFDKTGTITRGEPELTDIITCEGVTQEKLLEVAYSLEKGSEHPLAKAVVKNGLERNVTALEMSDFEVLPGNGLRAKLDGKEVFGGKHDFIAAKVQIPEEIKIKSGQLAKDGKTPLFFAYDGELLGVIAVSDVIKSDSAQAISELKNMGIHTVMLTGDNLYTAKAIGKQAGVDEVIADVLPDQKENAVKEFCTKGKTAMVGDGINDAPALTRADTGIAIGAGTDVAIDAADIVLVNSALSDVVAAIRLSRATLRNIKQNLFWAFIYNVIGIPLAAGVFISLLGWEMNPMFSAAAMSLSSFCVVTNALRLNFANIRKAKHDRKIKLRRTKEKKDMEKILKIEGMMCPHCEARVKKVLEELDGVTEVIPSHKDGTAVVKMSKEIPDELLKKTVEDQGYKVL